MSAIATVYAVFGSQAEAESIGRAMVKRGLAACVNILGGCRSIYRWQGAIEEADEVPALFKTTAEGAAALIAAIAEAHSYGVPAVVAWPIAHAHPAYAEWVKQSS
ncbi:MAG: divalent-cation tolerance protein CutA [Sphingomonadaceae bacterium]|nr:divalent-cation tolerance protein CutA [Sphingomonadaceae bacterium]